MFTPYHGGWTIEATQEHPMKDPRISLEVEDINALPGAMAQLASMGVDLSKTAEVLRKIEEEHKKQLDERRREDLRLLIELSKDDAQKNRRILIAYWKDNQGSIDEGIVFRGKLSGGQVAVKKNHSNTVEVYASIDEMQCAYEDSSDLVLVEYLD